MYKKLLPISIAASILLTGCGSSEDKTANDKSETTEDTTVETGKKTESEMSIEKAAVELSYAIEEHKLQYPDEHDDLLAYKEQVAKLRPYVDALMESKPKNDDEKAFVDESSIYTRDGFMETLDEFVMMAESQSTKSVLEYFDKHKADDTHNVKDVLWNTVEATEYTFGDIKQ